MLSGSEHQGVVPRMEWVASGGESEKEARTKTDQEIARHLNFQIFLSKLGGRAPSEARWRSEDAADVAGGYHCDGLGAAGITFTAKLKDGK